MKRWLNNLLALLLLLWTLPALSESLRVDSDWLNQNLAKEKLVIVDTRPIEEYELGHIPGAISLPDDLTYQHKEQSGLIVEPNIIQNVLRERGIDTESFVVVYDDGSLVDAARVFWTLEVYGLKQVRVLNGGFADWQAKNLAVNIDTPKVKASNYVVRIDHRRIASKFSTRLATINPNQRVIDARSEKAYRGEVSTAERFGHIPSAINISVHQHFEQQAANGKHLLPIDELAQIYKDVPKHEKVVLYCEIGRISTTNYLALRELGYDVSNYDASWREWGNDLSLPIEK